jgi:hypothetical protein
MALKVTESYCAMGFEVLKDMCSGMEHNVMLLISRDVSEERAASISNIED